MYLYFPSKTDMIIGQLHRFLFYFFIINIISYLGGGNLKEWWNGKCTVTSKIMCKSLRFSQITIEKCKFETIHLMLITVLLMILIVHFTVGIRILFIGMMKLKINEILFFMVSPAFHHLEFLWNFIGLKQIAQRPSDLSDNAKLDGIPTNIK